MKALIVVSACIVLLAGAFFAVAVALPGEGEEALAAGDSLVGSAALGAARRKAPSAEERRIIEDANLVLDAVDGATFQVVAAILERGSAVGRVLRRHPLEARVPDRAIQALGAPVAPELPETRLLEFPDDGQDVGAGNGTSRGEVA